MLEVLVASRADDSRWCPNRDTERREIAAHDGVRSDHATVADGDTRGHRDLCPEPDALSDRDWLDAPTLVEDGDGRR
jgi:hypothetical protein